MVSETVRAAIVDQSGSLAVRELPMPIPGEYGALCKMLYGTTCTGTDQHILAKLLPWRMDYPLVLGHESVGQVVSVGERVRNIKIGDLVTRVGLREQDCRAAGYGCGWGGFATYGVAMDYRAMKEDGLAANQWGAYRVHHVLPPDFDPRAATMIVTWRETLSYTNRIGVKAGASVVVIGAGSVGLSFVRMAMVLGASCVAAVGGERSEAAARQAGADLYFDYRDPEWEKRLRGEKGDFDFIIDSVASRDGIDRALSALRPGGTCGVYGIVTEPERAPIIAPVSSRGFTYFPCSYDEEEANDQVVEMVAGKKLDAAIWLDFQHLYDLRDINAAFASIRGKRCVKALIRL